MYARMTRLYLDATRPLFWVVFWLMNWRYRHEVRRSYRAHRREFPRMRLRGGARDAAYRASAVVCVYYTHTASVTRLVKTLADQEVDVFVVVNREATVSEIAQWAPHCVAVLERVNLGADFGAYKDGLSYLMSIDGYGKAPCILANDSVYYFDGIEPLVSRMLSHEADVCGMLINKEFEFHVQSMLIRFSARTMAAGTPQRFFAGYRPRFSKVATIRKGELRLTKELLRAGHSVGAVLDPRMISESLSRHPEALWRPELARGASNEQVRAGWSMQIPPGRRGRGSGDFDALTLGAVIDRTNPSHMLALTLTRALKAPLKLDMLSFPRGATSLAVVQALQGFVSEDDVATLSDWFAGRPSYASVSGIHLAFQRRGIR